MVKKCVSFKDSENDLVIFAESKRSFSCYIKDLIEKDMNKGKEIKVEGNCNEEFTW